jgi:general secretion pathway protein F
MPVYRYKAISESGRKLDGEMAARSQTAVIDQLRSLGHFPVSVDEATAAARGSRIMRDFFGSRRLSQSEIGIITRELSIMVQAGVPLDHALEIMIDLGENNAVKRLVRQILEKVKGGSSLADALAAQEGVFWPFYLSMIRAGEAGGSLDVVLGRLADYLEKAHALRESIRSALVYPAIVLVVAGLSVVFLLTVVLPQFRPLFEDAGQALPMPTQIMLAVGDAVQAYWWLMLLGIVGVVIVVRRQLSKPAFRLRWDGLVLRLALFGDLVKKLEVARFSRTLSMLLSNGLPMMSALAIVKDTLSNQAMAKALQGITTKVKEGQGLYEPLAETGVFPPLSVKLVRMGEETGRLEDMLVKVAEIYDSEAQRTVERLLALLVPVVTIFLGVVIAAIITSLLMAIFSINDLIF